MSDPIEALGADPRLGPIVETHGPIDLQPADDPFRRLLISIVRQQVSMEAAAAIRERLFAAVEPTPAGVLAADEAALREAGLSEAKVEYVRAAARQFEERGDARSDFAGLDDAAVVEELTEIRGVGTWTAKMFLMFALAREDVFPVEDLGIRAAMRTVFEDPDMDRAAMRSAAEAWSPYRSYASKYLWAAVED